MNEPVYHNADDALSATLKRVMNDGTRTAPRGRLIKELVGTSVAFDMRYPIVTRESRRIGYRFYAAEAAWILSGRNDLRFFHELDMPFIWEFSDDGVYYQGAYGPRVIDQLTYVCDAIAGDPSTRQAVMTVWRPNPRPSRDVPCTLSYQFLLRDGALHCVQSMRSSDVWLGYPYDAFNATMLTAHVILLLRRRGIGGLTLGTHTLLVGSQHVYEDQWSPAYECIGDASSHRYDAFDPARYAGPDDLLDHLLERARHPDGVDPRKHRL